MSATKDQLLSLAKKFEDAGWGNVSIDPEDLAVLGLPEAPESYIPKGQKWDIKPAEEWDDFCRWVAESITNEPFQGSQLRGRGFRSQENGKMIADILRKKAD